MKEKLMKLLDKMDPVERRSLLAQLLKSYSLQEKTPAERTKWADEMTKRRRIARKLKLSKVARENFAKNICTKKNS